MQTTIMMDIPTRRKVDAMSKEDATTMASIISQAVDQMYRRRLRLGLLSREHCALGENLVLFQRKAKDAVMAENREHFQGHVDRLTKRLETMYKGFDFDAGQVEQEISALKDKSGDIGGDLAMLTAKHESILEDMGECLAYLSGRSLLEERAAI